MAYSLTSYLPFYFLAFFISQIFTDTTTTYSSFDSESVNMPCSQKYTKTRLIEYHSISTVY